MTRRGCHFKPPHLESDNLLGELEANRRLDVQKEEDEVLR